MVKPGFRWRLPRLLCTLLVRATVDLQVDGLHNIPRTGPLLLAARHYHFLYDGAIILALVDRPVAALVTSDWATPGLQRRALERLCALIGWPVVGRHDPDGLYGHITSGPRGNVTRAIRQCVRIVAGGKALLVFPEGFPNVDHWYTPKHADNEMLPFSPGFAAVARLASQQDGRPTAVSPIGLHYERSRRWRVTLRVGAPMYEHEYADRTEFVQRVEQAVMDLSGAVAPTSFVTRAAVAPTWPNSTPLVERPVPVGDSH